jgi:enediyne polyketide synthase
VASIQGNKLDSIAVVGMGCIYPGAHSPEELWANVLAGRRFFRKAPAERMPPEYFDPDPQSPDKSYCDRMAVITGWEFDPLKFRIPPVTARTSDIAHWLALYTADVAVKDSGLDLTSVDRTRAGVMLGNSLTGEFSRAHNLRLRWPYAERALRRSLQAQGMDEQNIPHVLAVFRQSFETPFPESNEDTLAGNMSNTIAGRVCNHFDFGGGGFTVDGACSSSLLGVVIACDALVKGDLDFALAGGVDVSLDPFEIVGFAKAQALAREDVRPYDERADGMMTGEGCGIVVLMRESDARARGLKIHALLKGWAYSSDGKGGVTAPEVEGQARALRRAYERAGYPMTSVGLIEGHGTGTPVGDKVELTAIQRVLQSNGDEFHCTIGSIKANIGHCKAAAGAAGLIKAIQAIKHKILPPTVNCEHPVDTFSRSGWKLRPSLKGKAWESHGAPRRASVSSMGFGGANSHVTLEEANPDGQAAPEDLALLGSAQSSELILVAASSMDGLRQQIEKLIPIAERICHAELTDLAATLAQRMPAGNFRVAVVADTPWGLTASLQLIDKRISEGAELSVLDAPSDGIFAGKTLSNPSFVALFPGQSSQRLNMGGRLGERHPFVRELYDHVDKNVTDRMFREMLGASPAHIQEWETQLKTTQIAQPAIVAASTATLEVLEFFGLRPSLSIGHSLGEISALHAAGAFDAATAVRLAAFRGEAMHSLHVADPGAMLAIASRSEDVQSLLEPFGKSLVISNYNSTKQTVVSGTTDSIVKLRAICQAKNIRCQELPVSHAFHSDIVAPASVAFCASLEFVDFKMLAGRVISTSTGNELALDTNLKELLARQIRLPVRFVEAVQRAAESNPALWIEVGPGGVLTRFVRDILGLDSVRCLPTDLAGEDSFHLLNQLLARAFILGFPVAANKLFAHRFHLPFDVDNYNPIFIVNPCERPVELPGLAVLPSTSVPARLLPSGVSEGELANYLANRGDFLRELIALDFRHSGGIVAPPPLIAKPIQPPPAKAPVPSPLEPPKETPLDKDSLLTFAVNWIAKRTGFPASVIAPDKRLRDNLNLDSIKVGELVVLMAKRANRSLSGDPAALANATLTNLVETVLQQESSDRPNGAATDSRQIQLQSVIGLGEWVRVFRMGSAPAPIGVETPQPLPSSGTVVIVGDAESPRTKIIAETLRQKGLTLLVTDAQTLIRAPQPSGGIAALIVLLPTVETDFLQCSSSQFDERVEGFASGLFHVFRWSLLSNGGFRGLVIRSANDTHDGAADYDAGAAFLKSLQLETANTHLKWLVLPEDWPAERWAATAVQELACSGRVAIRYSEAAERTSEAAHPLQAEPTVAPGLDPEDVVLVSGGGKGITFELASELARQTGCKLALLGSSPAPVAGVGQDESQLVRNLERLRQTGVAHGYFQADVTDLEAVRRAVADVERQLGCVTAIFHGAGVTQLRSLRDKPLDEFLNCLRIKTRGLYNLLSAVPPARLKALHVISSVLGNSGMRGQTDYTFANAWLDEAVRQIQAAHPAIHCLSLGYSVWADAGLGMRIGALDTLRAAGVTPISLPEGVAAYRQLLNRRQSGSRFIITGRLTADLEANLYAAANVPPLRFLQKLLRWIPSTEIIANSTLSHATDLYLPEHVFEGTPMFPGVMAIEAMVQAAIACAGRDDLPVLRNISFRRPLIVPEVSTVVVRMLALADMTNGGCLCVHVAIRSDSDDFQQNHFEADCWFGLPTPTPETLRPCQPLPESLDKKPEDFSPVPLFQGKFFRRIAAIRKLEMNSESWTDVLVPERERYFRKELPQDVVTFSPAARDAFFQSGALLLPPGSLPEIIREWRVFRRLQPGERLHCLVKTWPEGDNAFGVDIEIRNAAGELVERTEGGLFRHSAQAAPAGKAQLPSPVSIGRVFAELAELLAKVPHALAMVEHEATTASLDFSEVTSDELTALGQITAPARQTSAVANLRAARRAATQCAAEHFGLKVSPHDVHFVHRPDGKPELRFTEAAHSNALQDLDISLADGHGVSVAWVGPAPVGVDIEIVETRDCETWRGLLGLDGYALALKIERETREPFDAAATRVWTLLEAGKKAFSLRRMLPRFTEASGSTWLAMSVECDGDTCRLLSALMIHSDADDGLSAIAVALGNKPTTEPKREALAKLRLDRFDYGLRADYSGPQEQIVFTKRFPVLFGDCRTPSKKVEFARYASWMGALREDGIIGVFPELYELFGSGKWGLATNNYRLDVLGELGPGDIVEGRLWQEPKVSDQLWLLKCDWRAINPTGEQRRVAVCEMEFSAVQILAHGVARIEAMPGVLREFIEELLPKTETVKPLAPLPCGHEHLKLGQLVWRGTSLTDNKYALFSHEILTTSENSNWVGNIYFANYGEWMARVRDLYFHLLTPDCYRNSGRDGEWVCLSCSIDHLSEAMPFDSILVIMDVAAIYRCGVDLTFDYYLLKNNERVRKLAHGTLGMAWVGRDSHNEPQTLYLPSHVVESLRNAISGIL